jgi:diguanylate cyclase (GGDEF)-like protein
MRLTGSRSAGDLHILPRSVATHGWTLAIVIGALGLVFALDRATGLAPVQHLYYVPIILASVRFGYRGSATAAVAIVLYHLANPGLVGAPYDESDLVQIVLFVAIGITAARLADDRRQLHQLAITDDLTGLHNLRSFEAQLRVLLRRAAVRGLPVALLVLDLDRLKSLNDTHGHLAGAEAVRTVGHLTGDRLPDGAVACRYGGDEFVIALPDCDEWRARAFADELRGAVNACAPVLAGVPFPAGTLSISVGIASTADASPAGSIAGHAADARDDAIGEALFRAADAALYAAKAGGRNRVSVAHTASAPATHPPRVRDFAAPGD